MNKSELLEILKNDILERGDGKVLISLASEEKYFVFREIGDITLNVGGEVVIDLVKT